MNDRYDHELLLDYIEGDLPAEKAARVDAMIASDDRLRQLVRGMQADRKALRALAQEEPARSLVDDVMQGMERQMLLGDISTETPTPAAYRAQRMRIGARLVRFGMYSGLAAAILVAGGVMVVMLSDFPLLDQLEQWNNGTNVATTQPATPHATRDKDRLALAEAGAKSAPGAADDAFKGAAGKGAAMSKSAESALADTSTPPTEALKLPEPARPGTPGTPAPGVPQPAAAPEPVLMSKTGPAAPATTAAPNEALALSQAGVRPNMPASRLSGGGRFVTADVLPEPSNARLELEADNPALARAALLAWASDNRVQVVEPEFSSRAYQQVRRGAQAGYAREARESQPQRVAEQAVATDSVQQREAEAPADTETPAPAADNNTYSVVLNDEQVPQLLNYLNNYREGRQRARLVEPANEEERRILNEEVSRVQRQVAQQNQLAVVEQPLAQTRDLVVDAQREELADEPQQRVQSKVAAGYDFSQSQAERTDARSLKAKSGPAEPAKDEAAVTPEPDLTVADAAEQKQEAAAPATTTQPRLNALGQIAPTDGQAVEKLSKETEQVVAQTRQLDADSDVALDFSWGAILSNQLPLAPSTPLAMLHKRQVILPVVITEIQEAKGGEAAEIEP